MNRSHKHVTYGGTLWIAPYSVYPQAGYVHPKRVSPLYTTSWPHAKWGSPLT